MAADRPKQYLPLRGRCLIEWTLSPFLKLPWLDGVVVALAADDRYWSGLSLAEDPRLHTVTGGDSRAHSVLAALQLIRQRVGAEAATVLVHDAARPCLRADDIERLRAACTDDDGALLALPISDTTKRAVDDRVAETLDRNTLWRAQTPQMFDLARLTAALDAQLARGEAPTDESAAMEAQGARPTLVLGSARNLKVTYAEDLALAEYFLGLSEG